MSDDFNTAPPVPPAPPSPMPGSDVPSDTGKILAGLGYLTGVVALIAILMEPYKSERFVRLHAVQALGLYVVMIALLVLNVIPILGQIIWFLGSFAVFVFAVMGAIKAFQGEMWEMPVVYGLVKQFI